MIFLTTEKLPFPNQFTSDYHFICHLACPRCERITRPINIPAFKILGYQVHSLHYPFEVSMYYECPNRCGFLVKVKLMMENKWFSNNQWQLVDKLPLHREAKPKCLVPAITIEDNILSPYHEPYSSLLVVAY